MRKDLGVDIQGIVDRYAEGLAAVDALNLPPRANQRTGEIYLPGLKSMREVDVVAQLDAWWGQVHPDDFIDHDIQVRYPNDPRAKCDQIITTEGVRSPPEWAIEVKCITLVGDNGKRNDFAVAKGLSPFLKDRSLYHDIERLRNAPIARHLAVVGYSFSYDLASCDEALARHPDEPARIRQIQDVCTTNGGSLTVRPIVEFADGIFRVKNLVRGQYSRTTFEAWRHPCGGRGVVFGWEVRPEGASSEFEDW